MFPALLIQLIIALVVIGLVLWVIEQFPLDATIKNIIRVIIIAVVVIWVLYALVGMLPAGTGIGYPYRR